MNALLVTAAPRGSHSGNRVTALRWAAMLRRLGHHVTIDVDARSAGTVDLLIALHARYSADVVARFARERPDVPRVVALTGTDVYGDLDRAPEVMATLERADRIVLLQPLAARPLPPSLVARTRTILQSATAPAGAPPSRPDGFTVCVLGHLRPVKDPLRAAQAARLLPPASRLRVVHVGGALSEDMARAARDEERHNPRYRWLGEHTRSAARAIVAASDLLALTSQSEGGANAISEAIAASVPVVSSRIDGSIGLLGPDYPGYFPVGNTEELAALLDRCERDPSFLAALREACAAIRPLLDPARELNAWRSLLDELRPAPGVDDRR